MPAVLFHKVINNSHKYGFDSHTKSGIYESRAKRIYDHYKQLKQRSKGTPEIVNISTKRFSLCVINQLDNFLSILIFIQRKKIRREKVNTKVLSFWSVILCQVILLNGFIILYGI